MESQRLVCQPVHPDVLARLLAPGPHPKRVTLLYRPLPAAQAARVVEAEVNAAAFRATLSRVQRRDESARTVLRRFADLSGADLVAILRELADDAGQRLADQGLPRDQQTVTYQVDVRYHGQGFEIQIVVDPAWLDHQDGAFAKLDSLSPIAFISSEVISASTFWLTPSGMREA